MNTETPPETLPDHTLPVPDEPNPRDRYGACDQLARAVEDALAGVVLDPFFDPEQVLRPQLGYSIHVPEGVHSGATQIVAVDAFAQPWPSPCDSVRTIYANPRFSGGGTKAALRLLHDCMGQGRAEAAVFIGPANLGSDYHRAHGFPNMGAIGHLGRWDFDPLVDMPAKGKLRRVKKGQRSKGGSASEVVAVLMLGPERNAYPYRYVDRFDRAMRAIGVPVSFARDV